MFPCHSLPSLFVFQESGAAKRRFSGPQQPHPTPTEVLGTFRAAGPALFGEPFWTHLARFGAQRHEAQALAAQAVRLRAAVALLAGAVAHHWRLGSDWNQSQTSSFLFLFLLFFWGGSVCFFLGGGGSSCVFLFVFLIGGGPNPRAFFVGGGQSEMDQLM